MPTIRFGPDYVDFRKMVVKHLVLRDQYLTAEDGGIYCRLVQIGWDTSVTGGHWGVVIQQTGNWTDDDWHPGDGSAPVGDRNLMCGPLWYPDCRDQGDQVRKDVVLHNWRYDGESEPVELHWTPDAVVDWLRVANPNAAIVFDQFQDLMDRCETFGQADHGSVELMLSEKNILQARINNFATRLENALSQLDLGELSLIGHLAREALGEKETGTEAHEE